MASGQRRQERQQPGALAALRDELPVDRLLSQLGEFAVAAGERGISAVADRVTDGTRRIGGEAVREGARSAAKGESPLKGALAGGFAGLKERSKEAVSGMAGGSGGGSAGKVTNIIEEIDVGVPVSVAYNQWTQFQDYSGFMKKVDGVEQEDDTRVTFKAQVLWSHRAWRATIIEQVPDEKIVWRSQGQKGHVDGTVTFHELAPRLTRILVVLEYHPQGLFERVGNLWRAQGRRARLELKHFRRHVMTQVILDPEATEGWRGEVHEGEVTRDHDEVVDSERREADDEDDEEYDEYGDDADEQQRDERDEDEEDERDEDEEDERDEDEEQEEEEAPTGRRTRRTTRTGRGGGRRSRE